MQRRKEGEKFTKGTIMIAGSDSVPDNWGNKKFDVILKELLKSEGIHIERPQIIWDESIPQEEKNKER